MLALVAAQDFLAVNCDAPQVLGYWLVDASCHVVNIDLVAGALL